MYTASHNELKQQQVESEAEAVQPQLGRERKEEEEEGVQRTKPRVLYYVLYYVY